MIDRPHRRLYRKIVHRSDICTPPCRMVVIYVSAWKSEGKEPEHHVDYARIFAIESRLTSSFAMALNQNEAEPRDLYSPRELLEAGFQFLQREVETGFIFFDPGEGYERSTLDAFAPNVRHRVMFCDWPEEQDLDRLSNAVFLLVEEALDALPTLEQEPDEHA